MDRGVEAEEETAQRGGDGALDDEAIEAGRSGVVLKRRGRTGQVHAKPRRRDREPCWGRGEVLSQRLEGEGGGNAGGGVGQRSFQGGFAFTPMSASLQTGCLFPLMLAKQGLAV